jgi:hypothetical protein
MTADEIFIAQEQPKQSWGRMIWRRAMGFGATTSTGLALDVLLKEPLYISEKHRRGYDVTHKNGQAVFTDTVVGWGDRIPGVKKVLKNPTARRYADYAALDSIYTMITSTILHKTNGAGPGKEPPEIGDDNAPLVDSKSKNRLRYYSANEDKKYFTEQELRKKATEERAAVKKPQESYAATIQQQQNASSSEPSLGT